MEKRATWYDKLGRLVRENNPHEDIDKTIVWEYDVSGNVTSRREYAYTEGAVGTQTGSCSFGYNHATHKDWLTSFVGIPITYDAMGNPTSYKGTTFGWSRGRLLTSATQGSKSISMGYNIDGVRCNKTVITGSGVVSTTYHYEGANLMHEVVTKNGTTTNRKYLYNSQGIVGFIQNDVEYIYHKNIFGDVVAIYQGATKVAEYAYDAYGRNFINVDIDGIATSNPFRYRGYYWDSDLNLYYLISRYYDPATSRFINADSLEYLDPETIGGLNLYTYCLNNPIMYADPNGHVVISTIVWIIIAVAALTTAAAVAYGIIEEETIVLDLSCYSNNVKVGVSLVLDFKGGNIELYPHLGEYTGIASGFSYSVGKISNYTGPGTYGGFFAFAGGGYYGGIDVCGSPGKPSRASATSITFSNGPSLYVGIDYYYDPISYNYKTGKFNKLEEYDDEF